MNPAYKKIYTCTPVAFHANDGFFIRDTGLIASTLRTMGVESKCIMPLPYYDDDQQEHLIRTEYSNLESPEWWKSLGIDALVLYSWGAPRYRRIAAAVRKAGIYLVIHMDTSGNFLGADYLEKSWYLRLKKRIMVVAQDVFRSWHLLQANVITMGAGVAEVISRRFFYGNWVLDRHFPMPCPVSPQCRYAGEVKENIILCIGRWDDVFQKRPEMLKATLEQYYASGGEAETRIYGALTEDLRNWHAGLPAQVAAHIKLVGYMNNNLLWKEYGKARVILCPSRHEGSHNVSAEALCCGCSVVVPPRGPDLNNVIWYTCRESGTVAAADTPAALARALHAEMALWMGGKRNPATIAAAWQPYFHADKVFNKIFE